MRQLLIWISMGLLTTAVAARNPVDLLQNKRVNLSKGFVLIAPNEASGVTALQVDSLSVYSYSRNNAAYLGLGVDSYASINESDSYFQTDYSILAGIMMGHYFTLNGGGGINRINGQDPSLLFTTNMALYFLDIAVLGVKYNYYVTSGSQSLSMTIGLTF